MFAPESPRRGSWCSSEALRFCPPCAVLSAALLAAISRSRQARTRLAWRPSGGVRGRLAATQRRATSTAGDGASSADNQDRSNPGPGIAWPSAAQQEKAKLSYKEFLLTSEEDRPFWYRLSDTILTAYGALCFVTSVVAPGVSTKYHFDTLEDFINVSFLVKFLLLCWSHDFSTTWLVSGKALLDLASCLPVLNIPARYMGDEELQALVSLTQIARFLRLLREALPSRDAYGNQTKALPVVQQITAVFLSLLGTVTISATVLYLYEGAGGPGAGGPKEAGRSFEDAILYMVSIFAGRDPPWSPDKPLGKLVSAAATCLTIVFIPFLVSRFVELFMGKGGVELSSNLFAPGSGNSAAAAPPLAGSVPLGAGSGLQPDDEALYWAAVVQRVDSLEQDGLVTASEATGLRARCLQGNVALKIYDLCYGGTESAPKGPGTREVYARRLRELLNNVPAEEGLTELPLGRRPGA